jgi:hypothetical protein
MDGQVGFSLSWRWLAILSGFHLVQQVAKSLALGALPRPSVKRPAAASVPVAAPAFGEPWKAQALAHSNQTQISFASPTLLNCQPSVKPSPPASLSINCLCVCYYEALRSACSSPVIPAISHQRHSRHHSKESHGALNHLLHPLTLQHPQRHPESIFLLLLYSCALFLRHPATQRPSPTGSSTLSPRLRQAVSHRSRTHTEQTMAVA